MSFLSVLLALILSFLSSGIPAAPSAANEPPKPTPRQAFATAPPDAAEQQTEMITQPAVPEETSEAPASVVYTMRVADQNGQPVPGATVKFCSDFSCQLLRTGDDGTVSVTAEPDVYHVSLLAVPEGYGIPDGGEKSTGPVSGTISFFAERLSKE